MVKHIQVNMDLQEEGEVWDIKKTACGLIGNKEFFDYTRDQKEANCRDCKRSLVADL